MILYCVRHGQSTYNAEGRIQGQSNVPLSELGRRQGEAVARALADEPIEALYCSPLRRALDTAQPVAEALGLEIQIIPLLKEIHAGIWEDRRRSEIEQEYSEELQRWREGEFERPIPGGESRRQLLGRGREAFKTILGSGYGHVVVVSHGGLLVVTLKDLLGIPRDQPPLDLENGSITKLAHDGDGRVELLALDQVDHLPLP